MPSDTSNTPESSPPLADPVDLRQPVFFNLPPFPSTVIRPPDLTYLVRCPVCGRDECESPEHRLVPYQIGYDPDDPVVLIVEDLYFERTIGRTADPSRFLRFAAGTYAHRSEAEEHGAVYAPLPPPLETK